MKNIFMITITFLAFVGCSGHRNDQTVLTPKSEWVKVRSGLLKKCRGQVLNKCVASLINENLKGE